MRTKLNKSKLHLTLFCFSDDEGAGSDGGDVGRETNPLLVDMEGKEKRDSQKTDMWFSKVVALYIFCLGPRKG